LDEISAEVSITPSSLSLGGGEPGDGEGEVGR
jgi:hypothetical protein